MILRPGSILRLAFSLYVSVSVCLFTFLSLPQLALQTWVESAEGERPSPEDEESSEERLAVASTDRRWDAEDVCNGQSRHHQTPGRLRRSRLHVGGLLAIVGHELANGLRAPVRI
jgi:hypothetical protein